MQPEAKQRNLMTPRQKAYVDAELNALRQHLVVAGDERLSDIVPGLRPDRARERKDKADQGHDRTGPPEPAAHGACPALAKPLLSMAPHSLFLRR